MGMMGFCTTSSRRSAAEQHQRVEAGGQAPAHDVSRADAERGDAGGCFLGTLAELRVRDAAATVVAGHLVVRRGGDTRVEQLPEVAAARQRGRIEHDQSLQSASSTVARRPSIGCTSGAWRVVSLRKYCTSALVLVGPSSAPVSMAAIEHRYARRRR